MSIKISEMTSATSLTGTETLPIVQGGLNKKATVTLLLTNYANTTLATNVFTYTGGSQTTLTVQSGNASFSGQLRVFGSSGNGLNVTSSNTNTLLTSNLITTISTGNDTAPKTLTVQAGSMSSAVTSGSGATLYLRGGTAEGNLATGGGVQILAGLSDWTAGGGATGNGGPVSIYSGNGKNGGTITINSGDGRDNGAGGAIFISSGSSTDTSGAIGGAITIQSGSGFNSGGSVTIASGQADEVTGQGGGIEIVSGSGSYGGAITIRPGYGSLNSGIVYIENSQADGLIQVSDDGTFIAAATIIVSEFRVNGNFDMNPDVDAIIGYYVIHDDTGSPLGRVPIYSAP